MGSGIRSNLQQKPYEFSNWALNGGLGLMANNIPLVNEHGASEGYMTGTSFVNSPKPLQHQFDQHPRPVIQGDGYGISNVDSFGSGNYYGSATSVGSMMNSQNLNSVTLSPISKTNSALIGQLGESLPEEPGRNDKTDDEVGGRGSEEQESCR